MGIFQQFLLYIFIGTINMGKIITISFIIWKKTYK